LLKIIFFPFYIPYKILKLLITSPLVRELILYLLSALVWFISKLLKTLRYFGLKIADQDGDGKLDKKDFDIAYERVSSLFQKSKQKNQ